MPELAPETRVTVNLLNKFGALTIDQIKKMYEGTRFNPKPMISFLCNSRIIQFLDDNYAVLQNRPQYSPETLYCLWVMLDKIKESNIARTDEIRSANPCDNGVEVCFINKAKMIEYIAFIDKNSISKVSMIQDTFYTSTGCKIGEEKDSRRLYTFVVNDEDVMDILAEMNLTIPFMVAYVEGPLTEVPSIEYYEL
ncbi:hypothetical protein bpr_IV011 (plasmid) [Butyrivibrio proteoclasticus B316]|uniref:Uncharacterized protein n=1 Tax=Butyrivibrio proteoclasticus (strain ATCC 51982 / DSM 14932 / B316) TaxID=515622 RepID=E0S4P4_BUTPB|nr:hypothetical protein [Butyrivibrio proteoclasticus]ADL36376.1 hypothetical protein bpr_IV011 [Butyrivibrio proteoclasticus B316]